MATISFDRPSVIDLLVSLGFNRAPNLSDKQILATINSTFDEYEDDIECSDPKLLVKIKKTLKKGGEIVLVAPEGEEEEAPAKSKKKKAKVEEEPTTSDESEEGDTDEEVEEEPKASKKAKASKDKKKTKTKAEPEPEEVEESEESEEEEAEEAPPKGRAKKKVTKADKAKTVVKGEKPTKKKPAKKEKGEKGPGVIDTIESILRSASKSNPITKSGIVDKLVELLPDREADKMAKTVAAQVPKRLIENRGMNIIKVDTPNGSAYYVSKK